MRTLLVDADSECYAAAAAAETRRLLAYLDDGRTLGPFTGVKEATKAIPDGAKAVLFRSQEAFSEQSAQTLLDTRLRRVEWQAREKYGAEMRTEFYVSGKVNYRHMVDPSYKGNRDNVVRPYWLGSLKRHAVAQWGARMTRTWEADDEIGIRATELGPERFVVCSVDKDLRQIAGQHIIINQGHTSMSERGATMRLYRQILAGDPTDGIRGCLSDKRPDWYLSDDTAFKVLEPHVDGGARALWLAVVARYQAALDQYGPERCGYFDARGRALHTAQLVYILRNRPDGMLPPRWTPPEE